MYVKLRTDKKNAGQMATKALMSAGADATATCDGKITAEMAAEFKQTTIVELLAHLSRRTCQDDCESWLHVLALHTNCVAMG